MDIDEAGRDDQAGGVDAERGIRVGQRTDRGDRVASDADVGVEPGAARAIDDACAERSRCRSDCSEA